MDGVLLDSSPIHASAYREAVAALPVGSFDYSRLAGMRSRDGMLALLTESGIALADDQLDALAATKSRIALERILAENPIFPGVSDVLRALSPTHALALATSASRPSVDAFLDRNGMRAMFRCVVHSGDVPRSKPAPDIFEAAARRLNLPPLDCLVVEDAIAGIQAARTMGAVACGIATTCTCEQLVAAGADCIIDRLEDLLELAT